MRQVARGGYFPFDTDVLGKAAPFAPWANDSADVYTLRKYSGKFGRGVAVEQGITNLLTASDWNTKLVGYNVTDGAQTSIVSNQADGWRRVPKQNLTLPTTEIFINIAGYTVVAGDRYTQSIVFRHDAGSGTAPTFNITFFTNNGHHSIVPTVHDLGNGVFRAAATYLLEGGATTLRAVDFLINTWGAATYLDLQEPVVVKHAGSYATVTEPIWTSHTFGTRADGILKYPFELMPKSKGTISCWIRPNYNFANFGTAGVRGIVTTFSAANERMGLRVSNDASASLNFYVNAAGITQFTITAVPPAGWDPSLWHHVMCTWDDTEQVLYYNGARVATRSGAFTRWADGTWAVLGGDQSSGSPNNIGEMQIDDLAILPRKLSDTDAAAIYALGFGFEGESAIDAKAASSEFVHLVEVQFSGGNLYLNTGAQNILWPSPTCIIARKSSSGSAPTPALARLGGLGFSVVEDLTATLARCRQFDLVVIDTDAWSLFEHNVFIQSLLADGQRVLMCGNDSDSTLFWATASHLTSTDTPTKVAAAVQSGTHAVWTGVTTMPDDTDGGSHITGITLGAVAYGRYANDAGAFSVVEVPGVGNGLALFIPRLQLAGNDSDKFFTNAVQYLGFTRAWQAVGGNLTFGGVEESGDGRSQGVDVTFSGVDQSVLSALLSNNFIGRLIRIRRAYLDRTLGTVRADPILLIEGLQLDPYEVTEDRDRKRGGTVTIKTRVSGRIGLDRMRGIWSNTVSHQHVFSGDTFFQYTTQLQNSKVYWGTTAPTSVGTRHGRDVHG